MRYEDLVSNFVLNQKIIYDFLEIEARYDEKMRNEFFSPTASTRQVKEVVHQKSIKKDEFSHHKAEFIDAFLMQREYWSTKNISPKDDSFFGYSLKNH